MKGIPVSEFSREGYLRGAFAGGP
jgi:hypothetical protein